MDDKVKNTYSFEDPQTGDSTPSSQQGGGFNVPIDVLKDLGGIPLPKDGDMGKWLIVLAVIVVVAVLWVGGSWINDEMKFKNQQIQTCNENFQSLNVKYILKDQELLILKNSNQNAPHSTQPVDGQ